MNTTLLEAVDLASGICASVPSGVDVAVCPPFPWLRDVKSVIATSEVMLGAQNCWHEKSGAFTGEVSPSMLAELCDLVLIGHSERRQIIGETDALVALKVRAALGDKLSVVLCVGENLEIRRSGNATNFVNSQLESALRDLDASQLSQWIIAYEPIWAIGTGVAATPNDAQEMASSIREFLRSIDPGSADSTRILYGGSVSPDNAAAILSQPDVDGALVGGASLKVDSFNGIVEAASRCA
jgi:triosephosphate isomerase